MFNWGDLQIVHRFFYEFFRVLGITWLIVVFAAIVTQGRIGQYGTFILPTQFLIALGFGIFKIINGQQQHFNSPDRNYSSSDSPKTVFIPVQNTLILISIADLYVFVLIS